MFLLVDAISSKEWGFFCTLFLDNTIQMFGMLYFISICLLLIFRTQLDLKDVLTFNNFLVFFKLLPKIFECLLAKFMFWWFHIKVYLNSSLRYRPFLLIRLGGSERFLVWIFCHILWRVGSQRLRIISIISLFYILSILLFFLLLHLILLCDLGHVYLYQILTYWGYIQTILRPRIVKSVLFGATKLLLVDSISRTKVILILLIYLINMRHIIAHYRFCFMYSER